MLNVPIKDSSLIILAAATLTATTTSPKFDLAFGNTLVAGSLNPGAGGAAMQLVVPVLSFESDYEMGFLGTPTGGTFTLTVTTQSGSATTAGIPYNAASGTIQTALAALGNVGPNVAVQGMGFFIASFAPALGVLSVTGSSIGLTGGATVSISVQTYSFQMFSSPDGINWTAASRVASVLSDSIPASGYTMLVDFSAPARYLQMTATIGQPSGDFAASIVLGDCYISPTVNRFG